MRPTPAASLNDVWESLLQPQTRPEAERGPASSGRGPRRAPNAPKPPPEEETARTPPSHRRHTHGGGEYPGEPRPGVAAQRTGQRCVATVDSLAVCAVAVLLIVLVILLWRAEARCSRLESRMDALMATILTRAS